MSYLKFNKSELVNLEYSLSMEMLSTNRAGGYTSTTIVGCNTRKYHGWMVCPIEELGGEKHVLLSSLDETIVQHEQAFNLGIRKYPGSYDPRGHKYIIDFEFEPTPSLTYRVGGVVLKKELIVVHNEEQILMRYTLLDAHSPTLLRLKPMLAYRNIHDLSKANLYCDIHFKTVAGGIASKLYAAYPSLYMQLSKASEFVAVPDWYYNVEYIEEKKRGYEYLEDLFSPGYFETGIAKGESVVFSASLKEISPPALAEEFNRETTNRPPKNSFTSCLRNTADQFVMRKSKNTEIVSGHHWYGCRTRDTFLSLPGLLHDDQATYKSVLDTISARLKNGMFPDDAAGDIYNAVDTPLWYFFAIQKYLQFFGERESVRKLYLPKMKSIIEAYAEGTNEGIRMHDNGLIWAEEQGVPKTWMNAVVDNRPVTPRYGYTVEVNALWYNAICFTHEFMKASRDKSFLTRLSDIARKIEVSYYDVFVIPGSKHLADYVGSAGQNKRIRPNQIIATSLPYSPLSEETKETILKSVEHDLLTPKGIRTVSPTDPVYKGIYEGTPAERDAAFHQGTVHVWLLAHYVEAKFKLYGQSFIAEAKRLMRSFEEDMTSRGLCTVAEVYNGDPPHESRGAISQAWSVAAILYIAQLIKHESSINN